MNISVLKSKVISTCKGASVLRVSALIVLALLLVPAALVVTRIVHAQVVCPCHVFGPADTPSTPSVNDENTPITLGMRFKPQADGYITGVRFYKDASMTDTHTGSLWNTNGVLLASGTFTSETGSGWQDLTFTTPVQVTAGSLYTATLYAPTGKYIASANYFTHDSTNEPLTAPMNPVDGSGHTGNGVFKYGGDAYPDNAYNQSNYWVDVNFRQTIDGSAPNVTNTIPSNGATDVSSAANLTATFDQGVEPTSVNATTVKLTDSSNGVISATISYDGSSKTVTINPASALADHTRYTMSIKGGVGGVANFDGTPMATDYQWSFTTGSDSCPCTIWSGVAPTGDPQSYTGNGGEVFGQTIHADEDGYLKAVRFYKPILSTATTHSVHVWSTAGTLLGSGTSSHESSFGWQEVPLSSGVPIDEGQDYIISFYSTDNIYTYSDDVLATQAGTGVLHANANGSVYKANSGDVFPSDTSPSNAKVSFWLDAVFMTSDTYTAPFKVAVAQPQDGAYGVKTSGVLTVKLTNAVDVATVAGAVTLKTAAGSTVSGTASYDDSQHSVVFTPAVSLAAQTGYTLTLGSSLQDIYGTHLSATTVGFTTGSALATDINQGLGGPVLVLTSAANPYDTYLAEMLRAEGINYFTVKDISQLSSSLLADYKLVLLGKSAVTSGQVSTLDTWVRSGGNLIAMQPDKQLASLLGLTDQNQMLNEGYIKIDTTQGPGQGMTAETMQYHGSADIYSPDSGTRTVASLYSDAGTPQGKPSVTQRTVGSGHAAAFLYDLPKSIALTHQGNPAWAGQDRDGNSPIRPNDLFNGNGSTDWLNTAKAHIPQADEQQRLLTNMMLTMGEDNSPLPRFWMLPHGYKTALVMVEDDHATANTTFNIFDQLVNHSTTDCSVADWTCNRSGSLLYTTSGLSNAQAAKSSAVGFSMGVHVQTGCNNYTGYSDLNSAFVSQISDFQSKYTSQPSQRFGRTHCYVWSDWDTTPKAEIANGIRYNMNYEWYPATWTGANGGYLAGSGMNMRFTDTNGNLLDSYQGVTDLDYETDPTSATMDADLDNALNGNEFYGVFGTHYDTEGSYEQLLIAAAKARNVPMISADQMLTWKDALGSSTFTNVTTSASQLDFTVQVAQGGIGMQAMVPMSAGNGALSSLKQGADDVDYTTSTIKGVNYAIFDAQPGAYVAQYGVVSTSGGGNTGAGSSSPGTAQAPSGSSATKSKAKSTTTSSTAQPASGSNQTIASVTNQTPFGSTAEPSDSSLKNGNSTADSAAGTVDHGLGPTLVKYAGGTLLVATFIGLCWWGVAARRRKNMIFPSDNN